eukprot:633032-Prymnesium_polylepis.3
MNGPGPSSIAKTEAGSSLSWTSRRPRVLRHVAAREAEAEGPNPAAVSPKVKQKGRASILPPITKSAPPPRSEQRLQEGAGRRALKRSGSGWRDDHRGWRARISLFAEIEKIGALGERLV